MSYYIIYYKSNLTDQCDSDLSLYTFYHLKTTSELMNRLEIFNRISNFTMDGRTRKNSFTSDYLSKISSIYIFYYFCIL